MKLASSKIQIDESVKKKLFSYAARLQEKSGKRVSLSDAIDSLLNSQQEKVRTGTDKERILSLFGILKGEGRLARKTLKGLRQEEEEIFDRRYPRTKRKLSA